MVTSDTLILRLELMNVVYHSLLFYCFSYENVFLDSIFSFI